MTYYNSTTNFNYMLIYANYSELGNATSMGLHSEHIIYHIND